MGGVLNDTKKIGDKKGSDSLEVADHMASMYYFSINHLKSKLLEVVYDITLNKEEKENNDGRDWM